MNTRLYVRLTQWGRCRPIATYILASVLWTTVLYAHAVTAGFASYDDAPQILQNPSLTSLNASLKYFKSAVALVEWPVSLSALTPVTYFLSIFGAYIATLDMSSH